MYLILYRLMLMSEMLFVDLRYDYRYACLQVTFEFYIDYTTTSDSKICVGGFLLHSTIAHNPLKYIASRKPAISTK